jgi:hypothetical protein
MMAIYGVSQLRKEAPCIARLGGPSYALFPIHTQSRQSYSARHGFTHSDDKDALISPNRSSNILGLSLRLDCR